MEGVFLFLFLVGFLGWIGPVAAIISLFRRTDSEVVGDSRVLWAIVVLFLPFAWIVYFLIGRTSGRQKGWRDNGGWRS